MPQEELCCKPFGSVLKCAHRFSGYFLILANQVTDPPCGFPVRGQCIARGPEMSLDLTFNENQNNVYSANSSKQLIYTFENYRLDVEHLMLYRDNDEISLTPKQVETLLALVEKNGEIVSKDVLMSRLWGDTAVEETNLIQNIHYLRKVLGNLSDGRPMIETLRRRGYRFVADLKISENGTASSELSDTKPPEPRLWFEQRPVAVSLAFIGLLGLVIIASSFLFSSQPAAGARRVHFAVLPIRPIDSANRSELYEVGVADLLIHRLNSIEGFVVRPLSSTRSYNDLDLDALAAGREQNVDHVLESNYQIADGTFRLTAQLINVESGQVDELFRVETDAGSVFAVQDAVASEIGNRIIARFGKEAIPAAKRGTNNEEAYRLYLQGRNLTMIRSGASREKAREYFEQAIKLDPNYALAHARMAHALIGDVEKAREFIKRALELDPNVAEAYVSRADIRLNHEWDFAAAESDLRRALELEPNNDTAHWLYGMLQSNRGNHDEALRELDTARELDPSAVMYMFHRGRVLYYARRYQEAIAQYDQAIVLDDRFIQPFGWMVRAYETQGAYETAYKYFLKREERSSRKDRIESYQKAFDTGGWLAVRRTLAESDTGFFDMARLYSLLGDRDAAFENLNKSVEQREWLVGTLNVEPAFDNLRNDPRFGEMVTRVGIK